MSKPIYWLYLGDFTEAWHRLSQEEKESLYAKIEEAFEQAGGKHVLLCDPSWSSEQWRFFGVNEYPDIEAVQKHSELLQELNWYRYVDAMSVLGTEWPTS